MKFWLLVIILLVPTFGQAEINSFWSCPLPDPPTKQDPEFKRLDGKVIRYNYATKRGTRPDTKVKCKYLGDGIVWTVHGVRQRRTEFTTHRP